ncbi:MAG TPA: glycosyltransferase family 2 protein [Isosphaeraceae bacterium]|jgi:dolichol-phosphate mannosyltransferase
MRDERTPPHEDEAPELSVVVPLYNEQENVAELYGRLRRALRALDVTFEVVLVDDGSRDATPRLIEALRAADPAVVALRLSRNFGHQAAVTAGLDHARGRAVVVMDGDLQDPPELIGQFLRLWRAGHDVVYAVRRRRQEGALWRLGYHAFYRVLGAISDLDIPLDSGDFCLMDRAAVEALTGLPERMRFVRGLRTFVGFRQVGLAYDRAARASGRPKYSFRALVALAIDGLVSFSSYPLRLVTYLGIAAAGLALALTGWVLADALFHHTAPRGWASTVVVVLFMGSVQLISLGIIGEYIRLIFLESKGRPPYIVDRRPPPAASSPSAGRVDRGRRISA